MKIHKFITCIRLSIHDLIKPRNFTCVAAVSCGICQIHHGICHILPWKTVGPADEIDD